MAVLERVGRAAYNALEGLGRGINYVLNPPSLATINEAIRALRETSELNEPGWTPLMATGADKYLSALDLQDIRDASHYYFLRDPLLRRAVQLIRDYTFGRGVSWRAVDSQVTKILEDFWNDNRNKKSISRATAQWKLSEKLQLDGEIFFVFFVNRGDGTVVLRTIPVEEITEIIFHPEDRDTPLYYKREWTKRGVDLDTMSVRASERRVDYYADWGNREGTYANRDTVSTDEVAVYVHHLKINTHGDRGVPLHFVSIPWVKVVRGFMEDRATLTLAQAVFAFKQKVKGNTRAVARLLSQWEAINDANRYATGGKERREGGRTLIENEAVDTQPYEPRTGASQAYQDVRMLRQQVAAGTGITEPDLTGDAQAGTWATISSMAATMRKGFEAQQQIWMDEFKDIFDFVLTMKVVYGQLSKDVSKSVEVDMPPITTRDLMQTLQALTSLLNAQTEAGTIVLTPRRFTVEVLKALGETDVEAALTEIEEYEKQLQGQEPAKAPQAIALTEPETFAMIEPEPTNGDGQDYHDNLEVHMAQLIIEMARLRDKMTVLEAKQDYE